MTGAEVVTMTGAEVTSTTEVVVVRHRSQVIDAYASRPAGTGLDPPDLPLTGIGQDVGTIAGITPPGAPLLPVVEDRSYYIEPTTPDERSWTLPGTVLGTLVVARTVLRGTDLDELFVPAHHEQAPSSTEGSEEVALALHEGGVEAPGTGPEPPQGSRHTGRGTTNDNARDHQLFHEPVRTFVRYQEPYTPGPTVRQEALVEHLEPA